MNARRPRRRGRRYGHDDRQRARVLAEERKSLRVIAGLDKADHRQSQEQLGLGQLTRDFLIGQRPNVAEQLAGQTGCHQYRVQNRSLD